MKRFYLLPVEEGSVANQFGPKYFDWRFDPDPPGLGCQWNMMRYGGELLALLLAQGITQEEHDALVLNSDVYAFPEDLDQPIDDPGLRQALAWFKIPIGWVDRDGTWHELLRQIASIIQLNQRYRGIYARATNSPWGSMAGNSMRSANVNHKVWLAESFRSFNVVNALAADADITPNVRAVRHYWRKGFVMGGHRF